MFAYKCTKQQVAMCAEHRAVISKEEWDHELQQQWPELPLRDDAKRLCHVLFDNTPSTITKGIRIAALTKACHQCQAQCVFEQCSCPGGRCPEHTSVRAGTSCLKVVCRRCLAQHYGSSDFGKTANGMMCPPCQGVCNCARHLRKTSKSTHLHMPPAAPSYCFAYCVPTHFACSFGTD